MNLHKLYLPLVIVAVALALFGGLGWLRAHDAWKDLQADLRVDHEKISAGQKVVTANDATVKVADKSIATAEKSNQQIDSETKRQLAGVQAQLASKPGSEEIRSMINDAVSGLKGIQQTTDANGLKFISVPDTQENRDAINKTDAAFKSCKFSLDDCQQKQLNFLTIIDAQKTQIGALQGSVTALQSSNQTLERDLKRSQEFGKGGNVWSRTGRVALPIGCAAAAAYGAGSAKASAKATTIATLAGGGLCALGFKF